MRWLGDRDVIYGKGWPAWLTHQAKAVDLHNYHLARGQAVAASKKWGMEKAGLNKWGLLWVI